MGAVDPAERLDTGCDRANYGMSSHQDTLMPTSPPDIVYFGDSLTDNENLFEAADGLVPRIVLEFLAGPTRAASDGVTHATYTAELLDLTVGNYAVAAARANGVYPMRDLLDDFGAGPFLTVPDDDPRLDFDINLGAQVDRFVGDMGRADLSGTTALILIGGNDYGTLDTESPSVVADAGATIAGVIDNIAQATEDLLGTGIGKVVLMTIPPPRFFPEYASYDTSTKLLVDLVFSLQNQFLKLLGAEHSDRVEILDTGPIGKAIAQDPDGFGLIAPYTDTLRKSDVLLTHDPDQVAFWDEIHPSTATHGILGAYNAHFLAGDPIAALSDLPDRAEFGARDNLVLGFRGGDRVLSGRGDDVVFGGAGKDRLRGQENRDILGGGRGADSLSGGRGADLLDGDTGNDLIRGNRGDDVLIDGLGSDTVLGGLGDDHFLFIQANLIGGENGTDSDSFDGGAGSDRLTIVLDDLLYAALAEDLTGDTPEAALRLLGIDAKGIETISVLAGREALSSLDGMDWHDRADVWGLI